ncbi:hypothetical protein KIH31_15515 [Paenarthrobacter sp. DKR-5]|uniref:DUF6153 family protein n=1 Tax=Paenarthrobacter sp. DKR-5 TaxID=2835535 RepID=UPI001BDD858D|nr:DUF6153 family protein [Paenarthrobacter sp. DKR-5]MBT1003997.1 hypothetical protein [Paenarthrobacter sp. DKR-5]
MAIVSRRFLAFARSVAMILGLLALVAGLLGMHVLAGGHGTGAAGQPGTAMAMQTVSAVHGHHPDSVLSRGCTDGTDHMAMAGACTLDRPQASVDGVADLPSAVAPSLRAAALIHPACARGSLPGADPPSLTLLGISRI